MMKRIIFFSLIVASSIFTVSCSIDRTTTDTMPPLVTTGLDRTANQTVVITQPATTLPWTNPNEAYLDYVWQNADIPLTVLDFNLISYAETWCDFMRRGMAKTNVVAWINEMAADQAEIDLWMVTAQASSIFICPDQGYKWNP